MTLVVPSSGVSTKDAYRWFDVAAPPGRSRVARVRIANQPMLPIGEIVNDLELVVAAHHPQIARIVAELRRLGSSTFGDVWQRFGGIRSLRLASQGRKSGRRVHQARISVGSNADDRTLPLPSVERPTLALERLAAK